MFDDMTYVDKKAATVMAALLFGTATLLIALHSNQMDMLLFGPSSIVIAAYLYINYLNDKHEGTRKDPPDKGNSDNVYLVGKDYYSEKQVEDLRKIGWRIHSVDSQPRRFLMSNDRGMEPLLHEIKIKEPIYIEKLSHIEFDLTRLLPTTFKTRKKV